MKPSALLAPAAALALLVFGSGVADAQGQSDAQDTSAPATADNTAEQALPGLGDAAAPAVSDAGQALDNQAPPAVRSSEMSEVLAILTLLARRLDAVEIRARVVLVLLASTGLLAAASLLLGLRQRRTLLSLAELIREQPGARRPAARQDISGEPACPAATAASPGTRARDSDDLPPGATTDAAETSAPAPRLFATERLPQAPAIPLASGAGDPAAGRRLDQQGAVEPGDSEKHHREIARLLARLRRDAPRLAECFADRELRERFRGEFDAPIGARLDRLATFSGQDDALHQRWLEPDLVKTLDALARFYSEAVEEERQGHSTGLAQELRRWLYESFGSVCRSEGWFAIDPVEPYVTQFDPRVHHAVAGRDVDGAEGRIVAIKSIGRRDPRSGAVAYKAEVIVGR